MLHATEAHAFLGESRECERALPGAERYLAHADGTDTAQSAVHDASVYGRILRFKGAEDEASRLAGLPGWQSARTVKAVPDKGQLPARARALAEGRTVFMAVPKLADPCPFYLLDPAELTLPPDEAASSKAAAGFASKVGRRGRITDHGSTPFATARRYVAWVWRHAGVTWGKGGCR